MYFKQEEILSIKNLEMITDINLYTKEGNETDYQLAIGDKVKLIKNKYIAGNTDKYHLIKDNLISQDFTEEEIKIMFSNTCYLKNDITVKLYFNNIVIPQGTKVLAYQNINSNQNELIKGIIYIDMFGKCQPEEIQINVFDLVDKLD